MKHLKHKLRDIIVLLSTLSGITAIYRSNSRRRGPLVRVVAFHDVEDEEWFRNVISLLVTEFNVITPEQFHRREFSAEKINILITFDDGYQSWVDVCMPVLEEHNAKTLFFMTSGLLDTALGSDEQKTFFRDRLLLSPKSALTWEGAAKLITAGHTIGGHTVTHAQLSELEGEELETEIQENKKAIESRLGITLVDFAYPFGKRRDYSEETTVAVLQSGYTHVYSAMPGFWSPASGTEDIPRTLIEKNQSTESVRRWILGSYDVFSKLKG